ncbi:uncharacterized protein AB675_2640 [Cyphellophora attinorum]|uniref:A-kinase anchor protein 7-like phosphoesterase domain-containing protein n=1 Tax=Cyphellophora attinorum TaxID=1664694 RepID=A0A0N0NRJ4_9EURO|nr:uncharacterized protein AB675_2640 [Phialophora attinorum]KPI44919.1 hypothetical protein AB675_2640 [Phialophora attinorum]
MTTSTTATRSAPPSESVRPAAPTAADQARPTGSPKQTKKHVGKSSRPAPTHFLALPLVTPSSIPQLARSVARFQDLTTASRFQPQALEGREREQETPERDNGDAGWTGAKDGVTGNGESMRIIPKQAHRPPGTLHLTLGTMVLDGDGDKWEALRILREVDFGAILSRISADQGVKDVEKAGDEVQGAIGAKSGRHETEAEAGGVMEAAEHVVTSLQTLARPVSPPPKPSSLSGTSRVATSTSTITTTTDAAASSTPPLRISLRGLGTFPSPRKARVFYASPHDPTARLQPFAEAIQQRFIEARIVAKEDRALTLHATVANLKYVRAPRWQGGRRGERRSSSRFKAKERKEIDARDLVEVFETSFGDVEGDEKKSFVWAENIVVDRVRICKMGAVKSEDEVMGMEYPAIRVPVEGDGAADGEVAEVRFF